jgi:hypothetical protein
VADLASPAIVKAIPWGALGISLVVHLTGLGIGAAIALAPPAVESIPQLEISTEATPIEATATPIVMNLTQWQPTPSGGSPNPLADAAPVELIPDAETLLAERPLAIGTGADLNFTEVIGESGVGGGTGSGEGNADGDGFFGLDLTGDRIVFVVDASRSMNAPYPGEAKNRLGRVKIEIYNTVRKMTADQKFFVVFFNTEPIPMPARDMIPAEPAIVQPYMEWIFKLKAQGQTNPESALLMALRLRPDKIYFLTDGDFSYRSVRSVREVNRGRVPIHTVGFGGKEGEANLREIAKDSQATYQYIPAPADTLAPDPKPVQAAGSAPMDAPAVVKPQ